MSDDVQDDPPLAIQASNLVALTLQQIAEQRAQWLEDGLPVIFPGGIDSFVVRISSGSDAVEISAGGPAKLLARPGFVKHTMVYRITPPGGTASSIIQVQDGTGTHTLIADGSEHAVDLTS